MGSRRRSACQAVDFTQIGGVTSPCRFTRIERIVSTGQASPLGFWYDQEQTEWVVLLSGSAGLMFEGEDALHILRSGSYVEIPAHLRHRVEWTDAAEPTVWLAVHAK
ncbi:cupin domain-containing protein (plasmid) [Methylocystis sp. MJC1]|nr:cupin domain-containing protein [Methylocystis sp. MJC1]